MADAGWRINTYLHYHGVPTACSLLLLLLNLWEVKEIWLCQEIWLDEKVGQNAIQQRACAKHMEWQLPNHTCSYKH